MFKKAIQHGNPINLPNEYSTLGEMLFYITKKYPQKGMTFIDVAGREEFLSYADLAENASKYLKGLIQKGIKPGDVLILEINDSKAFYHVFWACILGGIIVAPVTQPASMKPGSGKLLKLMEIWKVLNKPVLVIEEKYAKYYQAIKESREYSELSFISTAELEADENEKNYLTKSDDLAVLQFSSGSTGCPKGVKLTHKNILTNVLSLSRAWDLNEDDTTFTWLPHTHDMGLFAQYLMSVITGCHIVIFSPLTFIRDPYLFLQKLKKHQGTWFCCPNFGLDWLTNNVSHEQLSTLDLSFLKFISCGAEPISVSVIAKFVQKFSQCGFKEKMIKPGYGLAEATVAVTTTRMSDVLKVERINRINGDDKKNKIEFVSEGRPISGISIRISDEHGSTLDENKIGEIQIKGPSVTSGYFNLNNNNNLFIDGWLRTGDLGFIADGSLVVTGRIKDILFFHGKNYYSHDLEEIILSSGIVRRGNIAVSGLFNNETQKEEVLVFVKHQPSIEKFLLLRQSIINKIHETLDIIITHVIPVKIIPKTTSGKLQRFHLKKCYENGDYNEIIDEINDYIKINRPCIKSVNHPQNELEKILRTTWSKILNISEDEISMDDEFFVLGGSSIQAFQLYDQMERTLNKEIDSEILILCSTIRQLAEYLQHKNFPPKKNVKFLTNKTSTKLDVNKAVAITGMALRFPFANTQQEFWDNLYTKKDCISKVSSKRKKLAREPKWNDWLGELKDIDIFDNKFFDITQSDATFMDPQQRLVLETSYEALEDAGLLPGLDIEHKVGVYAGISANTYYQLVTDYLKKHGANSLHHNTLVRNLCNLVPACIAHQYNFAGPAIAIDTACSSFLVALHYAVESLRNNSISGAVVVGSNILVTSTIHSLSRQAGILSSTKHSKVFDKNADGTVLGEGIVVFYLEKLNKAIEENKNIYGIVRGTAINNDGISLGAMSPNPRGQYKVIMDAYKDANISPNDLNYIEVHGTGTAVGDPVEMNVLSKLFSIEKHNNHRKIGVGSVKTNIGHLLPAAGGAGLAKILMCLKNKTLVPSLHMKNVNPFLNLENSPFYVVKDIEPWIVGANETRKAGLSSFGLGGTNAHVVIEEWKNDINQKININKRHLLTLSAKSEDVLKKMIDQTKKVIEDNPSLNVNDLCFTRNRYRNHYAFRAAGLISEVDKNVDFIFKGKYLKRRPANICVIVNDLKNIKSNFDCKDDYILMADEEIKKSGIDVSMFDRSDLKNFSYWYLLLKILQKNAVNSFKVIALDSGKILTDILIKNNIIKNDFKISEFECDVILNLGNSKEAILEIFPNEICNIIKIININPVIDCSLETKILSIMGELYISGVSFDWKHIYPNDSGKLITLPSYPFAGESFWINSTPEINSMIINNELFTSKITHHGEI